MYSYLPTLQEIYSWGCLQGSPQTLSLSVALAASCTNIKTVCSDMSDLNATKSPCFRVRFVHTKLNRSTMSSFTSQMYIGKWLQFSLNNLYYKLPSLHITLILTTIELRLTEIWANYKVIEKSWTILYLLLYGNNTFHKNNQSS